MRAPRVTVHYAQSLDGRIATCTGDSQWIGGPASLKLAHQLRADHAAVLVGVGTVLADNPRLTVRLVEGPSPRRIVVDSPLRRLLACLAAEHGVDSVLIEGGGGVITSALRQGVVDRLVVCIAARLIGSGVAAVGDLGVTRLQEAPSFRTARFTPLEKDVIFDGELAPRDGSG